MDHLSLLIHRKRMKDKFFGLTMYMAQQLHKMTCSKTLGHLSGLLWMATVYILASSQIGSGKIYTMCGPSGGLTKDMGINYFALNDLFQLSNKRKDIISYNIYVQMVEIYNEQVRDLLAEDSSSTKYPLSWLGICSVTNATLHSVKSIVDVLNLMKHGDKNHAVGFTVMNNQSSRSHSVFTVHVHGKDTFGNILHSHLYLVDLAGSEQVHKSEVTGDRLKEAQHINKSPSCLGDVFTSLSQKSSYIPYRNSKLTLLLQDTLGGHAKTLMFAHVSPKGDDFGETLSTLKFARRVSGIELGAACLNKRSSEVKELKQQFLVYNSEDLDFMQIENLKKALVEKVQYAESGKTEEEKSPRGDKIGMPERTPQSRLLSHEYPSAIKSDKVMKTANKKSYKTPSLATKHENEPSFSRGRRLSFPVANNGMKDHLQIELPDEVSKFSPLGSVTPHQYQEPQEG
ncbi:hypothetical protein Ancab_010293 [Ancistrocladus abbreviatus]